MNILFVTSEAHPFIKTGGLGDVAYALPKALKNTGDDVRVIMPKYASIKEEHKNRMGHVASFDTSVAWRSKYTGLLRADQENIPFYFIDNEEYFGRESAYGYFDDAERFAFFSRAVVESIERMNFIPDVIHCNDWQSALVPFFLKTLYYERYGHMKVILTVHNLKFQGLYGREVLKDIIGADDYYFSIDKLEFNNAVSFMKAGINYSDHVSTVSKTYAEEIKYPFFGEGLEGLFNTMDPSKLSGITNGIDYDTFNPEHDKELTAKYNVQSRQEKVKNKLALQKELGLPVNENIPMIGIVSRLTDQKGFDLIAHVMGDLRHLDIQIVLLGTGDEMYENMFRGYGYHHPDKISANITFDATLAKKIYASSDMFLMPSIFEPCGLSQLISMRYGTIPIVRETGGLRDTVEPYNEFEDRGTGFSFSNINAHEMLYSIKYALEIYQDKGKWDGLVRRAMETDNSWGHAANEYKGLYWKLINR